MTSRIPSSKQWIVPTPLPRLLLPSKAFNTNSIVYDNTPWRPGRVVDERETEDDERKLKNLATRIMSNGVEVLVKDKSADGKQEQRTLKLMHISSLKPSRYQASSPSLPKKSLLSSAVATVVNHQQMSTMFPLQQLMRHNYIIKTCMTTFTYLTTVVQNKRSAVSTFETIVSVITTESLTNLYATDVIPHLNPTKTKFMEVKTIQPSAHSNIFASSVPKIDKRIDSHEDDIYDIIQPSEVGQTPCTTTSCSCSHTKTEDLKTQYTHIHDLSTAADKYGIKTTKYSVSNLKPTNKDSFNMKTPYHPYDYENISHVTPTDKVVEKYTEVINEYSDEKDVNSVEESELLTNEQAPSPPKNNKIPNNKVPDRHKFDKVQKPNKNKLVVAELLKLGSLGIKGLSQLAPVLEKMTGGFIKRQETEKVTTTTPKADITLTAYNANKRVDSDVEFKQNNFPIYIPVDELETSESQMAYTNATLHQNIAWAAEYKQPKAHIVLPKIVQESPLVNGGIPISPGEIIRANSDVIVGKPAVGGPLTLAASGIKLQNPVNPPPIDSFMANDEQYVFKEKPPRNTQSLVDVKVDDSFDLRPPNLPNVKPKPLRISSRPGYGQSISVTSSKIPTHIPVFHTTNDNLMKTEKMKNTNIGNHGRPLFLDYIPSLVKPPNSLPIAHHVDFRPSRDEDSSNEEIADNSPSSSEIIDLRLRTDGEFVLTSNPESVNKPFLVDIQPSRVANVLIPHGSSTALVFAGSSEPHKTGDYIDDPLPYPEPGYFGSFSIDAPQMTNVHNVAPNNKNNFIVKPNTQVPTHNLSPLYKETTIRNDLKSKWNNNNKRPIELNKISPPTSNQAAHMQVGPQIALYNPDIYKDDFDKYNKKTSNLLSGAKYKDGKEIIDKEYENYLAVPPPPPPKRQFHQENHNDNSKPYNQRPIIHTKPIQDMKVFLNVQHPITNNAKKEQMPPKITSEIYFASQMPNTKPTSTYTVQMPQSPTAFSYNKGIETDSYKYTENNNNKHQNSFSVVASPNFGNKTIDNFTDKDTTYSVTLNTATNVASHSEKGQVIGSSLAVPVNSYTQSAVINANIPIGTNFAITVEDDPENYESYNIVGSRNPSIIYPDHSQVPVKIENNEWNKTTNIRNTSNFERDSYKTNKEYDSNKYKIQVVTSSSIIKPSINSHANFPMINDQKSDGNQLDIKPFIEYVNDNIKSGDQRRPAKLIPNIPTNSHGWYSSVLNENSLKNINNIKVEATTRKIIPLTYDYNKDVPNFGEKVSNAGKPPTDFWDKTVTPVVNNFNIGKPFTKTKEETNKTLSSASHVTVRPNYINFDVQQLAYDIPIRDNSDETTTVEVMKSKNDNVKPVYENSEEVYDGSEEGTNESEIDGEVSSESMKVPVISVSNDNGNNSKFISQPSRPHEIFTPPKDASLDKSANQSTESFNSGTQTEKPFSSYNKTTFQSNSIKPIYEDSLYMKPRPFTINTLPLDHQLQQPHWQINQLIENSTNISYEEGLDLNIGEEMGSSINSKHPVPAVPKLPASVTNSHGIYKKPQKTIVPVYSNNTRIANESNIITSVVHINDKKPLLLEITEKSTLPTFTIVGDSEVNQPSSEIINLSPPPPTLDYNFKPSTNDEMIMGMSPPPPQVPSIIRLPPRTAQTTRPIIPMRTPPPYRTLPPRTLPPRLTTQRPLRKPAVKDEVSTYRPTFDAINKIKRPSFNRDQPSSQLLPPPMEMPSKIVNPIKDASPTRISNVVFPTPISSGWLTSSGFDFSSSFNFAPTSVYQESESSKIPDSFETVYPETSFENTYDNVNVTSTEMSNDETTKKPLEDQPKFNEEIVNIATKVTPLLDQNENNSAQDSTQVSSHEDINNDKIKVIPLNNKNRTRKPYPVRNEDRKPSTNKFKLPTKSTPVIKPSRTLSRPEVSSRVTSIKKIVRPIPTRTPLNPINIIESSESPIEEEFIKPTEVLKPSEIPTILQPEVSSVVEKTVTSTLTIKYLEKTTSVIPSIHHYGNEVKIFDEIQPTKTEFKTTVVTHTKTLSEPPKTVSSIGYVNLTHTLTVTHTETSLISQSEGAVTQTLVLTNTQTSTVVDVITEIYTQVQPTTIVETVTKHIPVPQIEPSVVQEVSTKTIAPLDDISMSSEEVDNFIIKDTETTENIQKIDGDGENDNDTFFVVMNKSQNGGKSPSISTDIETGDYDGITRNEQVNSNGVSQVLFGEILLAGTPYLETTNVINPTGVGYGKECQPDCKASRNERCQRIDGIMKCVCRPGFARMFPDRPCKPTYTYSVKLALGSQGNERLQFHESLSDNSSKEYHALAMATHEGINRMVMQSDLRDVYHGVHITGFQPIEMTTDSGDVYQGVLNDFYVQLSDNAHESRLKEVIEKYLRNNNFSLGGTDVHAAGELVEKLDVSDFDECTSGQFHDCSEHSQCFNLRGTYTCSCLEGYADLSVNSLYPGRICSAEPVGCERCNYHGSCYSRDDHRVLCECFQWYAGSTCHINLKVVLISLVVLGALLMVVLAVCAVVACSKRPRPPPRSIVACIQGMPSLHQGGMPKQRTDRRALISERNETGDSSSVQNASLPYMPSKRSSSSKKCAISDPPAHAPPPPPAPQVMIPRARLHPHHSDSRDNLARKRSLELSNEAKLISYLESGATNANDEMRRKHSMESSYSTNKDRHNKQGALVSAGFKVSTTIRPDEAMSKDDRDDLSSVNKTDLEAELSRFDTLRKSYSQEDISEWTDAERRLGELTLSEARSVGGTLPASTGRAASSTRLTSHQEADAMAERDLGSTFLLPHVHLYKPDLTSDVSEFDSL